MVNDFVSHNLSKNSASLKGHCLGKNNSFIFFYLGMEYERKQDDRQTVQSKQMKINLAPHLADRLELNETHLLIHMVAQSDVAATQRAMSLLPCLQV